MYNYGGLCIVVEGFVWRAIYGCGGPYIAV